MKAAYRMLEPTPMGSTSTTSGAALLSTLLVVGIGCAAARVPQAAPGPRTMVVHSGRTIRELLQPEDKVVFLVHDDIVMVEAPPPPPRDALRRLLDVGPWYAVAVVKVNHAGASPHEGECGGSSRGAERFSDGCGSLLGRRSRSSAVQ